MARIRKGDRVHVLTGKDAGREGRVIAVFPANVHMALHPTLYPEISPLVLWLRLPLQGVLIAWAWWYTRPAARTA